MLVKGVLFITYSSKYGAIMNLSPARVHSVIALPMYSFTSGLFSMQCEARISCGHNQPTFETDSQPFKSSLSALQKQNIQS